MKKAPLVRLPANRLIQDGIPIPQGYLPSGSDANHVNLVPKEGDLIQAFSKALAYWPDGSIRYLKIVCHSRDQAGFFKVEPSPDPIPGLPEQNLKTRQLAEAIQAHLGADGVTYHWKISHIEPYATFGNLQQEWQAWGWMVDNQGNRYTWVRAFIIHRPALKEGLFECWIQHSNMQPHGQKRGSLQVDHFEVNSAPGFSIMMPPEWLAYYPIVNYEQIISMKDDFLMDSQSQVIRFWMTMPGVRVDWSNWANYSASPILGFQGDGYHESDGVMAPVDVLKDAITPHRLQVEDRTFTRYQTYLNTRQPGYGRMGWIQDMPNLLGQGVASYEDMLLLAASELERPVQNGYPSAENPQLWVDWACDPSKYGDRYEYGYPNLRVGVNPRPTPDQDSMEAAIAIDSRAGRKHKDTKGRQDILTGFDMEHGVVPEFQAGIRTGIPWFWERLKCKAECAKTVPGWNDIAHSERTLAYGLGVLLNAYKATGNEHYWSHARSFMSTNLELAGQLWSPSGYYPFTAPDGQSYQAIFGNGNGNSWSGCAPWMGGQAIQYFVAMVVEDQRRKELQAFPTPYQPIDLKRVYTVCVDTMRFYWRYAYDPNGEGFWYKLSPYSMERESYPIWNSSRVHLAYGIGSMLYWFGKLLPPKLRKWMQISNQGLLAGANRDSKGAAKYKHWNASAQHALSAQALYEESE